MRPYLSLSTALVAILSILAAGPAEAQPRANELAPNVACHIGAYSLPSGEWVMLLRSDRNGETFDYVRADGQFGGLDNAGNGIFLETLPSPPMRIEVGGCPGEQISVAVGDRPAQVARRLPFPEETIHFSAGGLDLAGKLVLPAGPAPRQVVVWVDGSDQAPSIDSMDWQYVLPMNGIGVFMLDKRGTGASGGAPTANFHLRADDVVAAVREMRSRMGPEVEIGLLGASQGGWVAPLAASMVPADFVVVTYGMAEGVPAEDREEIVQDLQGAGYGDAEIRKAMELQVAATAIVVSHWQTGWEAFDALKRSYANEPWFSAIGADGYTGVMLRTPTDQIRAMGPQMDLGISFGYDPLPTIRALETRQLWVLGGADMSAPSERTQAILENLQRTQPQLALAVFPNADHGITETSETNGVRSRRRAAGYWDLVANWIRTGELRLPAGAGN